MHHAGSRQIRSWAKRQETTENRTSAQIYFGLMQVLAAKTLPRGQGGILSTLSEMSGKQPVGGVSQPFPPAVRHIQQGHGHADVAAEFADRHIDHARPEW